MLDFCAPGWSEESKKHLIWVRYNGKTFHLPKGGHGKKDPEIQKGYIKRMVRYLEIDPKCAKDNLAILQITWPSCNR
jgi:calcineurin-like phosphoesterase family protein